MFLIAWSLKGKPLPLVAFMIVITEALLTGMLHLDGLADWADGRGGKTPDEILRIMKDSTNGAFGIGAIILSLMGKFAAINSLLEGGKSSLLVLITAPTLSRWALSFLAWSTPYARSEGGTGAAFVRNVPVSSFVLSTAFVAPIVAFTWASRSWLQWCLVIGVSVWIRHDSIKRIGGITGDVLGAACEICTVLVFFVGALSN